MSHTQCSPSRHGHSWRELNYDELRMSSLGSLKIVHAVRVCKRCGQPGRVDAQGVIHAMELP